MRHLAPLAVALALALVAGRARAAPNDGVYGRFDGDLELRAEAGVAVAEGGPSLAAGLGLLYLGTAGLYAHYTDALGTAGPAITRSLAAGVLMQPLFLARYGKDLERGPARFDLLVDSFSLGMGAFWDAPRYGALRGEPGLELALGLGVPLSGDATGLFLGLRGALRLRPEQATLPGGDALALFSLTLSWHHLVPAHLVDAGDRLER